MRREWLSGAGEFAHSALGRASFFDVGGGNSNAPCALFNSTQGDLARLFPNPLQPRGRLGVVVGGGLGVEYNES